MPVRAIDEHGIRQRNIQPVFDDRGRHQHIVLVAHEGQHHALQLRLAHLPVAHGNARRGHQLLNARGNFVNRLHAIVHKVNLPAALQLHLDRRANNLLVELGHHGLNRHAVLGRRLNHAHIAQAHQRHMQRARNRRGAHGQHVDLLAHLLQPFLVAHAEALLLIHNQQTQILELDIFREQPVRADQNIHLARLHALDD